ncbi:unnamed protein product [Ectocarpus sp. CCAP 1310/34]|nr:unnamed protein product [Ectocarpus sp. CCAP 1310/34]
MLTIVFRCPGHGFGIITLVTPVSSRGSDVLDKIRDQCCYASWNTTFVVTSLGYRTADKRAVTGKGRAPCSQLATRRSSRLKEDTGGDGGVDNDGEEEAEEDGKDQVEEEEEEKEQEKEDEEVNEKMQHKEEEETEEKAKQHEDEKREERDEEEEEKEEKEKEQEDEERDEEEMEEKEENEEGTSTEDDRVKQEATSANIVQNLLIEVPARQRSRVLENIVTYYSKGSHAVVITGSKAECDELADGRTFKTLTSQTIKGFLTKGVKVLVVSDVDARGIDMSDIDLVVHYRPPRDAGVILRENYP